MHRHKYCHVHQEDKNRTRKKTRWEMRVVKRKQKVLRPHKTTVRRMVLQKAIRKEKKVRYETRTIKVKKMVQRKEMQKQTRVVMKS
jgi:hypothetical protein